MSKIGPMIAASARLGVGYAERLLTGIEADQFARFAQIGETVIESNHPAFICGHLSLYPSRVIEQVGADATDFTTASAYEKLFSHEAKCVDDPDGTIYPAMDELVGALLKNYRGAIAALEAAEDDVFAEENPYEAMRGKFPTKGAMHAFYVGGHVMMHMGQFSAWRRAMGLGAA